MPTPRLTRLCTLALLLGLTAGGCASKRWPEAARIAYPGDGSERDVRFDAVVQRARAAGALYQVHRSTVARWLVRARQTLHEGTLARLQAAVGAADPAEAASLVRLVRSQLDLSLGRALAGDDA